MYFVRVARPRDVLSPSAERRADRVQARHERRRPSPSTSSAPVPIRVMIRMRDRHVRRVGELDADLGDRRARAGPSRTARRTSCGRASRRGTAPSSMLAHLGRVAPVVRRPGVLLALGADERAVLDARDVARVRQRQVGVRALGVREPLERARVDQLLASRSYSSAEPSHQWIASGCVSCATSSTQRSSFWLVVRAAVSMAHVGDQPRLRAVRREDPGTLPHAAEPVRRARTWPVGARADRREALRSARGARPLRTRRVRILESPEPPPRRPAPPSAPGARRWSSRAPGGRPRGRRPRPAGQRATRRRPAADRRGSRAAPNPASTSPAAPTPATAAEGQRVPNSSSALGLALPSTCRAATRAPRIACARRTARRTAGGVANRAILSPRRRGTAASSRRPCSRYVERSRAGRSPSCRAWSPARRAGRSSRSRPDHARPRRGSRRGAPLDLLGLYDERRAARSARAPLRHEITSIGRPRRRALPEVSGIERRARALTSATRALDQRADRR